MWRNNWDEIVGQIMPDIEETLFDIEEHANKYQIKKAKELVHSTNERLDAIDSQLDIMVDEIEQLVSSEQKNRAEIGELREKYTSLSNDLLKKRGSFNEAIQILDEKMAHVKTGLASFDEATKEGSYLQARQELLQLRDILQHVEKQAEVIPKMMVQVRTTIPADIKNLENGIADMKEKGYQLDPLVLEPKLEDMKKEVEDILVELKSLNTEKAEERMTAIQNQIDQIYDTLDNEVQSKKQTLEQLPNLKHQLDITSKELHKLLGELAHVQQSYRLAQEEVESKEQLSKQLTEMSNQLQVIVDVTENEKQTFTSIYEMVNEWEERLQELSETIKQGSGKLYELREEELKAKETISRLRAIMLEGKRVIRKSNIPGLPARALEQLEEGDKMVQEAVELLNQVPLEMKQVTEKVEQAISIIESNDELIGETIKSAELAERVIQYSNRYRNRSEETRSLLAQAERLFRHYEYDEAIESAVRAVEPFEKGIVERVSEHVSA
ncbi:septation ring formation regulator EzrA [Alkalicoccobacillus plakortidis]|uniref:Septation ring formation regulator EzrA n=1 Tax=Alkalicoccobacillus plakortidis TaxID=444060 RepID=A0ABT0XHW0_9BACI|nr:septation ring formation regulator EzrA [Alkalicoccobacillus plakortidis]MCM2675295.1 septation ring formation regulator EzrA [Alkalicoccobacillus plakortidis]